MSLLRRLLDRLTPGIRLGSAGVRPVGTNSLLVAIADRSYWVQAELQAGPPPEYRVWASDVRDVTHAATVIAAPPAPADAARQVRQRLEHYFSRSGVPVTYL